MLYSYRSVVMRSVEQYATRRVYCTAYTVLYGYTRRQQQLSVPQVYSQPVTLHDAVSSTTYALLPYRVRTRLLRARSDEAAERFIWHDIKHFQLIESHRTLAWTLRLAPAAIITTIGSRWPV